MNGEIRDKSEISGEMIRRTTGECEIFADEELT